MERNALTEPSATQEPEGNSLSFRFLVSGALKIAEFQYTFPVELLKPALYGLRTQAGGFIMSADGKPITKLVYKRSNRITTIGRCIWAMIDHAHKKLPPHRPFDLVLSLPFAHHNMIVFKVGYTCDAVRNQKVKRGFDPNRRLYVLERRIAGNADKRLDYKGPFFGPPNEARIPIERYVNWHPESLSVRSDLRNLQPSFLQDGEAPAIARVEGPPPNANAQASPDLSPPSEKTPSSSEPSKAEKT